MPELAVRESVTVAGRAERAWVARAFAAGVLGPGHPCGNDAMLLVSELFGNSVRHSGSGRPGGTVTVAASCGIVRGKSPTAAALGCRNCDLLAAMPKAAAGFSSSRAWRCGGGGGGAVGAR